MGFGDLKSDSGLKSLNEYLQDRSYIEGYQPSQADHVVFSAMSSAPKDELYHALRWYNHIKSYGSETAKFAGTKKDLSSYGPMTNGGKADNDDDDDDLDLFGSDDDDAEAALAEADKKAKEEAEAKKKSKPALIEKSSILLDVKPWDDETDMEQMEKCVRTIKTDGLLWGASKFVPVAYGVRKLQIMCVVEDAKVGTDFLEEEITKFEDYVQSVDIAAFNKI